MLLDFMYRVDADVFAADVAGLPVILTREVFGFFDAVRFDLGRARQGHSELDIEVRHVHPLVVVLSCDVLILTGVPDAVNTGVPLNVSAGQTRYQRYLVPSVFSVRTFPSLWSLRSDEYTFASFSLSSEASCGFDSPSGFSASNWRIVAFRFATAADIGRPRLGSPSIAFGFSCSAEASSTISSSVIDESMTWVFGEAA